MKHNEDPTFNPTQADEVEHIKLDDGEKITLDDPIELLKPNEPTDEPPVLEPRETPLTEKDLEGMYTKRMEEFTSKLKPQEGMLDNVGHPP